MNKCRREARQASAGCLDGFGGYLVIHIQIPRMMRENRIWFNPVQKGLHPVNHIQQCYRIHAVIRKICELKVSHTQQGVSAFRVFPQLRQI